MCAEFLACDYVHGGTKYISRRTSNEYLIIPERDGVTVIAHELGLNIRTENRERALRLIELSDDQY